MAMQARVCAIVDTGFVDVEFPELASCRGCEGACRWFRQSRRARLRVARPAGAAVGDDLIVELPARFVLGSAALLHGLLWGGLLAGAAIGASLGGSDLSCLVGAVGGFGVATAVLRRLQGQLASATAANLRAVVPR
jgi:positive regulator of sigma E activity